jgi:cation-transporting ATPase E
MVVPAAAALFSLKDQTQAAIAVSGMAIVNTAISLFQEIRARIQLDKLAILVETKARVLRDGQEQSIPADDVVQGDTVLIRTGEAVVADGPVIEAQFLEIDEALLTGESDPVRRHAGEPLLSGSFCVAGEGAYRADKVGPASFAQSTSSQARHYHTVASPMTRVINRLVQILSYSAAALIVLFTVAYWMDDSPRSHQRESDYVRRVAATITSLVPQGMVLTATISFSLGAIYMGRRGAVVQRLNAVEAMASINVICTDKTGTLTTNKLRLDRLHIIDTDLSKEAVEARLRLFASASVDRLNKNIEALRQALGVVEVELLDQIPFKSQNRYSAVLVRADGTKRMLVLGAYEALRSRIVGDHLEDVVLPLQRTGLRVLMFGEIEAGDFAEAPGAAGPPAETGEPPVPRAPALPDVPLRTLALVCLSDELRPEAGKVLEALYAQGISFKIISGDNPETVRATVKDINLPLANDPVVSGVELTEAANPDELIRTRSVFGRVSPQQKVAIVESLKKQGFNVAMIGDGVNDVLPIKHADLGIAMGDGSQASKTVAGLILRTNDFALLPQTLEEGRTIVRNLRRSCKLFLVKNVYSLILIVSYVFSFGWLPFPYAPQQVTLLNWLVIGIPAFVIALSRERATLTARPPFLREVGLFALCTGALIGLAGLAVMLISGYLQKWDSSLAEYHQQQRTMLLSVLIGLGVITLFRALADGDDRPNPGGFRWQRQGIRLLAVLAIPVYVAMIYWPAAAGFFELVRLNFGDWIIIVCIVQVFSPPNFSNQPSSSVRLTS